MLRTSSEEVDCPRERLIGLPPPFPVADGTPSSRDRFLRALICCRQDRRERPECTETEISSSGETLKFIHCTSHLERILRCKESSKTPKLHWGAEPEVARKMRRTNFRRGKHSADVAWQGLDEGSADTTEFKRRQYRPVLTSGINDRVDRPRHRSKPLQRGQRSRLPQRVEGVRVPMKGVELLCRIDRFLQVPLVNGL